MKARVHYQCQPRRKSATYEAEDICIDVDLPFVPAIGTMLKVSATGDYMKVDDVFLDLVPDGSEGEGLVVYLEEPADGPDFRPWPEMKAQGWRITP